MAGKNMKARIVHKHDTEANWQKATNFIPMNGELIVYEADEKNPSPRFKFGDGTTFVCDLPFFNGGNFSYFDEDVISGEVNAPTVDADTLAGKSASEYLLDADADYKFITANLSNAEIGDAPGELKLQSALTIGDNSIYPLTTADQVLLADGTQLEKDGIIHADHSENSTLLEGKGLADIMLLIYPVGSIYMSVNSIGPDVLFGGTWEPLSDRFLIGAGGIYEAGDIGGSETHTIAQEQMPAHTHDAEEGYVFLKGTDGGVSRTRLASGTTSDRIGVTATSTADLQITSSTTGEAGGGEPVNHMPPYMAVNIWKRIA